MRTTLLYKLRSWVFIMLFLLLAGNYLHHRHISRARAWMNDWFSVLSSCFSHRDSSGSAPGRDGHRGRRGGPQRMRHHVFGTELSEDGSAWGTNSNTPNLYKKLYIYINRTDFKKGGKRRHLSFTEIQQQQKKKLKFIKKYT